VERIKEEHDMRKQVNGIDMKYELTWKQNAPVVVLSHSLASSLIMWDPQMDALTSRFRVLRYDTRGHGGTDAPKEAYTLDLLAEDLISLMDTLEIEEAHFVGLSMGGMIGQTLALKHPARFLSFVLCDTAAIMPEETQPLWKERIAKVRKEGMQALADETLERWFTSDFLSLNPPIVKRIRQQMVSTPAAGYVGCAEAIRTLNYLDRLEDINKPVLILVGEKDQGTPVEAARAIHERIEGSQLEVIPSAAHLSNIQQTDIFNSALIKFLSGQDGDSVTT
jgi:3-oxoadipate enol-lactonase